MGNKPREKVKTYSHGGERGEKTGGKCERREESRKAFCLRMHPDAASTQMSVNHHLAQTLLVAAYPRLADIDHPTAHCFTELSWTEGGIQIHHPIY